MNVQNDIDRSHKEQGLKNKKILIRIISIVVVAIVILISASYAMNLYLERQEEKNIQKLNFNFAPADYEENIFEDQEYVDLVKNGFIDYTDYATNLTLGIDYSNAISYGEDVQFMVDYIYSIINGDAELYNEFFSDNYYKKNDPKERFTMQKLYEVNISRISETKGTDKAGNAYNEYQYRVVYKILDNNGTFRNDFNTGTKEQYISFTNKTGEFLIDSISTPKIKP